MNQRAASESTKPAAKAQEKKAEASDPEFKKLLNKPLAEKMAAEYGQSMAEYIAALKASSLRVKQGEPEFSNSEIQAFLTVAHQYQMDPLRGEIYCMRNRDKLLIIVGVDGWIQLMHRNPQFNGVSFEYFDDAKTSKPLACKAIISRKDMENPIEVTEYLDECSRGTEPWKKWPRRMLRHKALIQCIRVAFRISGIIDEDEANRAQSVGDETQRSSGSDELNDVERRLKASLASKEPEMADSSK